MAPIDHGQLITVLPVRLCGEFASVYPPCNSYFGGCYNSLSCSSCSSPIAAVALATTLSVAEADWVSTALKQHLCVKIKKRKREEKYHIECWLRWFRWLWCFWWLWYPLVKLIFELIACSLAQSVNKSWAHNNNG